MPSKYYFLTDFIDRDAFFKLKEDFEKHRELSGKHSDIWGPGELEKFALDKGFITPEQYQKITRSVFM